MKVVVSASELLAAARFADNKKCNNPCLKNVYIEVNEDRCAIVSTDGFKMIEFERGIERDASDVSTRENFSFLLGIDCVKACIKSTDEYCVLDYDGDTEYIYIDIFANTKIDKPRDSRKFKAYNGKYPDCKSLLDGVYDHRDSDGEIHIAESVWLDPKYLSAACSAVKSAYGKDARIRIDMGCVKNGITCEMAFYSHTQNSSCRGLIMPVRM